MIINKLRQCFVLFVCYSLAFSPLLRAAQLSLPTSDLVAPKITQDKYIDTVENNKDHRVNVTVKDNVGVKQVILYYRVIGTEAYKSLNMKNISGTDEYESLISSGNIQSPGIEYYIQAMDHAGNTLLHGYSFSPLSVKTIAGSPAPASEEKDESLSKLADDEDSIWTNKWLWIGIGVVALAAGGGGGGGGGSNPPATATLTVNTAEPVN